MQPALVDPASPGSGLLNCVLALLAPPNPDENERYDEEILDLTVVGFFIVTNIDIPKTENGHFGTQSWYFYWEDCHCGFF